MEESTKTVLFNVEMACNGCANACSRILNRIEGVRDVSPNVEDQIITVVASESVSEDEMLQALQKWASASNKAVSLASS